MCAALGRDGARCDGGWLFAIAFLAGCAGAAALSPGATARAADQDANGADARGPVATSVVGQGTDPGPTDDGVDREAAEPSPYAPVFKTTYEPSATAGRPAEAHEWIRFQNLAQGPGALESPLGHSIFYESGTISDRYARVIDDPTTPGNSVLQYWLRNAAIPTGRVVKVWTRYQCSRGTVRNGSATGWCPSR